MEAAREKAVADQVGLTCGGAFIVEGVRALGVGHRAVVHDVQFRAAHLASEDHKLAHLRVLVDKVGFAHVAERLVGEDAGKPVVQNSRMGAARAWRCFGQRDGAAGDLFGQGFQAHRGVVGLQRGAAVEALLNQGAVPGDGAQEEVNARPLLQEGGAAARCEGDSAEHFRVPREGGLYTGHATQQDVVVCGHQRDLLRHCDAAEVAKQRSPMLRWRSDRRVGDLRGGRAHQPCALAGLADMVVQVVQAVEVRRAPSSADTGPDDAAREARRSNLLRLRAAVHDGRRVVDTEADLGVVGLGAAQCVSQSVSHATSRAFAPPVRAPTGPGRPQPAARARQCLLAYQH